MKKYKTKKINSTEKDYYILVCQWEFYIYSSFISKPRLFYKEYNKRSLFSQSRTYNPYLITAKHHKEWINIF